MVALKKAVVTGGSHGIGKGIVYALAKEGYDVLFSYNSHERDANSIVDDLKNMYPTCNFYALKETVNKIVDI